MKISVTILLLFYSSLSFSQAGFQKIFGEPLCYEEGFSMVKIGTGGYLVSAAYSCTNNPFDWKSWLLHLDENGDTIWTKKDGVANGYVRVFNGEYLFIGGKKAGLTYDTIFIFNCNVFGDTLWTQQLFFPQCNNVVYDLIKTLDDGFALTGIYSSSLDCNNLSFNSFVAKLSSSGAIEWKKQYYGIGDEQFFNIRQLPDLGFALFGWTDSYGAGQTDFYLLRTDENGDSLWSKTYGGTGLDYGYGMDLTSDGGFILTGYSDSAVAIKTDAVGNIEWQKKLAPRCGGTYFKVIETLDNQFAFLVYENTSLGCSSALIKTDLQGNILWKKNWGGLFREVNETAPGSFLLAGYLSTFPTPSDVYVIKFDTTFEDTSTAVFTLIESGLKIYPNPATEQIIIKLPNGILPSYMELADILGNKKEIQVNQNQTTIQRNGLLSGIYFLNVYWKDGRSLTQKILLAE